MIPPRLQHLDRDKRGYPIPWNVLRAFDGTPFFTVNDDRQHFKAIRERLCPICGTQLDRFKVFVGGPRSAFDRNGWYQDLPMHEDCAHFALRTCPYLAAPRYLGRIDVADTSKLPPEARVLVDTTQIPERPLLFVALIAKRVIVNTQTPHLPYTRPMKPIAAIEYWQYGQQLPQALGERLVRDILGATWRPPKVR